MPNEDRIRRVYDLLTEAYDIPQPFEEVQNKWQTSPESRRKAYDLLTEAYEIRQPYEEFEQLFVPGYNEQGQAAATAAPSKPASKQGDMEGKTQPSTVAQNDTAARVVAGGGYTPRSIVPSSKEDWDDITKRAGELKAEEKAKKEQLEQAKAQSVAAAQEQQDYVNTELRKAQREERKAKWRSLGDALLRSASAAPSMTATSAAVAGGMSPSQQMAMEGAAEAFKEYGEHKLVAEALDESIDYVNAVADQRGVGKGAWDYATRIGTFDFGYSDIVKGLTLQQLAEKSESGEPLSEEEERVLDMVAQATYLTQLVQDGVKMGYNVGASLPQSLGFMAGIALNPASGLGQQMMKRAAKKYGDRAFKTMATRALGDVAEMGIATLTTGGGRVLADAIDRVNGDVTYDITPEGYIAYGGQQNKENLWKAAAKAFGTNFIENYTEALGDYFSPLGKMLGDLTSKNLRRIPKLNGLVDFINAIPQSQWGEMVGQFMEATKFDGVVGEILEEEIGMFLEPVFVRDSTLAENFNIWSDDPEIADRARDNQLTTILSCALMSGMLYGVQGAGARGKLNRELAHADREGKRLLGEEGWNNIHTIFDSADGDVEKLERLMKDVVYGKELTNEQRTAIVDYAAKMVQTNQFNASNDAAKQEMTKTASELSAAYDAGYRMATLDIPQNFRGVRDDLYWSEDAILEYDKNHLDINLLETAHNLRDADMATREQVLQGLPSEQADLVKTYLACSERFNGLYQGTKDAMEADKMTFIDMVRPAIITNADGQEIVRTATTAYGESVYVVGGEGKVSYILDGNGQKSAYPTDQLKGISETTVEELESQFDKALEDRYMARLEHYTQHNEQTQEPVVGMILGDGNENYVITDMGEGWATIQEAMTDKEGNMVPKPDGKSRDVTKDYLLAFQDQIYDRRDAMDGKPVPSSIPAALQQNADDTAEQQQTIRDRSQVWSDATGVNVRLYDKMADITNRQVFEALTAGRTVVGWYDTNSGEVGFYTPYITDISEMDRTFIHEVVAHKGMRMLLGEDKYNELCQTVWDELMNDEDRNGFLSRVSHLKLDEAGMQKAAADEYIAYFAERMQLSPTDEEHTIWERIVQMVKSIMDRLGLGESLTTEDLGELLQASLARFRQEVAAEQTAQPAAEEQKTPSVLESIPTITDKEGNITDYAWSQAPDVETALAAMREAGYSDEDIRVFSDIQTKELKKKGQALEKKVPRSLPQQREKREAIAAVQQEQEFWNAVIAAIDAEIATSQAEKEALDAYGSDFQDILDAVNQMIDETDFESLVAYGAARAKYIWADSDHGTKGFASHMFAARGNKRGERMTNIGWLANRDKGGKYPEEVAESIFADLPDNIKEGHDEMEALDIVIDTIRTANHPATVIRDIYARLIQKQQEDELREQQRQQEEEERQQDAYARDYGFVNYQEMLTFEELWASGEDIVEIPTEQLENYYNTLYGTESNAGVGPESQGLVQQSTGQDKGDGGGDTLLPAEGSDSGAVGNGTASAETGTDAVLPGAQSAGAAVEAPYTIQGERTMSHPASLRAAYESGNKGDITKAEKAVGDFIMSSDNQITLDVTVKDFTARKKKAEKGSAEQRMCDFVIKKCRERINELKKAKESQSTIQGLEKYSENELNEALSRYVEAEMMLVSSDEFKLKGIKIVGSRMKGTAKEGSDLDVLVEYEGSMREDEAFNMLNREEDGSHFGIDGIRVDFNPIKADDSGTIEQWLKRNGDYDKNTGDTNTDKAQAAIEALEGSADEARDFIKGTGKAWRDKPLTTLAEAKWFMNWIGYDGGLSKIMTNDSGRKFVKYKANGVVTPNIYLGETTPREILKQFLLYGNVMNVSVPTDIQKEFEREQAAAKKTSDALWADDREQIRNILTEAGIPFVDVIDSERGSRIIFTDRKNDNGNYLDYMDVSSADQAKEDIEHIRVRAGKYNPDGPTLFRETDNIRERAIKDGTFMKAPNGKPTRLTERQWLLARTRAFRKWFGNWLKPIQLEKLRKSDNISIKGDEITPSDDLKEYRKNALEYGKNLRGEYTNADTGNVIRLTGTKRGGLKEILEHDYKDVQHLQSIAAIPQIIEKGIYIETLPNDDKKGKPNIAEYDYYVCGLNIGGEDYTVKAVIGVDNNGQKYYDHKLTSIEKGKLLDELASISISGQTDLSSEGAQEGAVGSNPTAGEQESIKPSLSDVKDKRLLLILQNKCSKIVDENGEPMVVYHGTPSPAFTEFAKPGVNLQGMIWLSLERDYAGTYANDFNDEENKEYGEPNAPQKKGIYSLFADIVNPLNIGDVEDVVGSDTWNELAEKLGMTPEELFNRIGWDGSKYEDSVKQADAIYELTRGAKFVNLLKEKGYDGVEALEGEDHIPTYGAVNSNQVKSAEPTTTDDNGNPIPKSKRFDKNKNDIRFRQANDRASLMGAHNISEEKLKKVIGVGGLANPSMAIVDTDKYIHQGYGDISLIPYSSTLDASRRRGVVTYNGDAWSPTYPGTKRILTKKGEDKLRKLARKLAGDYKELYNNILNDFWAYADDNYTRLAVPYLLSQGEKVEIQKEKPKHSREYAKEVAKALGVDAITGDVVNLRELTPEQNKALFDLLIERHTKEVEEQAKTIKDKEKADNFRKLLNNTYRENIADKDGNLYFNKWNSLLYSLWRSEMQHENARTDWNATRDMALRQIEDKDDYWKWIGDLLTDEEWPEKLYAGTDSKGRPRYIPNTLENASRLMNREKDLNSYDQNGYSATKAMLLKKMRTLSDIRRMKDQLATKEEVSESYDKLSEEWFDVISQLSKMQKISDNQYSNVDYAEYRLQEAILKGNPVKYLNDEYGYDIDENSEYAKQLKDIIEKMKNAPVKYFETKFSRPVYLYEFKHAIVPNDIDTEVRSGLEKAGIRVTDYESGNTDDFVSKVREATEGDSDVRFRETSPVRSSASDIILHYDNQDGSKQYPYMSNAELIDAVEESEALMGVGSISELVRAYRMLEEEDRAEGKRDYAGGEMDDLVEYELIPALRGLADSNSVRFREANLNQEIFVSNAQRAVEGIKQDKATPQQWLAMIQKQGGIKAGEDKWLRLSQWLQEQTVKTLTKQEVLGYIRENKIQIEEQLYSERPSDARDLEATYPGWYQAFWEDVYEGPGGERIEWRINNLEKAVELYNANNSVAVQIDIDENGEITDDEFDELLDWADRAYLDVQIAERGINPTHLSYSTEGLDNKREIALWVPDIEPWNESDPIHFGDAGSGRAISWIRFGDARGEVQRTPIDRRVEEFGEPIENANHNLVYHPKGKDSFSSKEYVIYGTIRTGEKKYVLMVNDGNEQIGPFDSLDEAKEALNIWYNTYPKYKTSSDRILVIDEIQSKRHQEGREKGYKDDFKQFELDKAREEAHAYSNVLYKKYGKPGEDFLEKATDEEKARFEELNKRVSDLTRLRANGIPGAPFEKNWSELAMKRMLRLAAEEGYDRIAWTTGEQQSERYNIGGYLRSIKRRESDDINEMEFALYLNGDNSQYITTDKSGNVVYSLVSEFRDRNLTDIIGKELAEKALALKENEELDTDDITISNSGMATFYDKMLVNFMNKYGKQWGVKVENIDIPGVSESQWENAGNGITMHSVAVTPEMKRDVMEGQVMFREANSKNKQPGQEGPSDVLFRLSNRDRETVGKWLEKRQDLTPEERQKMLDYFDTLEDKKLQLAAGWWFTKGTVRFPEDMPKVEQAVKVAGIAKVDPMQYSSPMELINTHANIEIKEKPVNPDEVSTLHKVKELPDGIVIYDVDNSEESRQNMRRIIDTHYGKESSPWCLLQGDGEGGLTSQSKEYWDYYNSYPKQVAFKNGKLLAFSANRGSVRWWDRMDEPHVGIPVEGKIPNDELGRSGVIEYDPADGEATVVRDMWRGNPDNGPFEIYYDTGQLRRRSTRKDTFDVGPVEVWHMNGQKSAEFTNNELGNTEGEFKTWHPNGQLHTTGTMINGRPVGVHKTYFDNGQLEMKSVYPDKWRGNEYPIEPRERFYPNGQIRSIEPYDKDGIKNGTETEWFEDGKKEVEVEYINNKPKRTTRWFQNGDLESTRHWDENGYKTGVWEKYRWDWDKKKSVPVERATYKNGAKNGVYEEYYTNGQMKMQTNFKDGNAEGLTETWNEDGKMFLRFVQKDRKEIGHEYYDYDKNEVVQMYTIRNGAGEPHNYVRRLPMEGYTPLTEEGLSTYPDWAKKEIMSDPTMFRERRVEEAMATLFGDDEMRGGVDNSKENTIFVSNNRNNERKSDNIQQQASTAEQQGTGRREAAVSQRAAQQSGDVIKPLRKLEEGEHCYVERKLSEAGEFGFVGTDRIESVDDVAFIFRKLESKAVENSFIVFVKDGKATILHVGMGRLSSTQVDTSGLTVMMNNLKPDSVFFVHNHPSGNVESSRQDRDMWYGLKKVMGNKLQPGIIIDTTRGIYGVYEKDALSNENREFADKDGDIKIPTYRFDELAFSKDYKPQELGQVRTSRDVAQFVASHRLGERDKISVLCLNQNAQVLGNFFLPYTGFDNYETIKKIARECAYYAGMTGAPAVILYGTGVDPRAGQNEANLKLAVINIKNFLEEQNIALVEIIGDATAGEDWYYSYAENGRLMEPQVEYGKRQELQQAEKETDTNPTDGQKEAGNYKKGHVRLFGMDLSIEQPKGSVRRGTDPDGKEWEQETHNTYGYIRGTMGRDKDHIDVFLGDNLSSDKVFVVDQRNIQNGSFDEHKVMLGFDDIEAARDAYYSNYEEGWTGLGAITETSLDAFKTWAFKEGRRVQPFSQTEGDGSVLFRMREPSEYKRIEDALGVAAVRYERAMDEAGKRMAEVMSDSMRSVKELQDAIAEQTGRPIRDYENAYWAAIQYSSRNKAMQDAYHKKFYRPLLDEVYSLTKDAKDREEALDKLNAYLMAKHGLERNEKFAMRDAERDALEQLPEEPRTPDEFDDTEVMEEYDSKYAKWKSEFDKLRDVLYDKYRRRDYSGLTALFDKKKVVEAEIDAQLLVDSYEKGHDTTELWRLINAATKETLRTSVQGGVITQEKYIELANMFDNYVPLRGFDETTSDDVYGYYGTVNSPYNTAIKKAYGRRSLSDSPLATIGNIADSEIMRANRNRIYMAALSLAENHHTGLMSVSEVMFRRDPDTGEWSIALPDLSDADTPELVAQKMSDFRKWFAEQLLTDDVNYRLSSEMAKVPYKVINKSTLDEHQIIAMRGGKQYIITVNGNPRAAQALAGKTNPDSSPALNWLAPFNRYLAGVFTQYNPSFVLRNLTRDGIYTNAMVWAKEDRKYALAFNKNWSRVLANMAGLLSKYKSELLDDSQPIERYFREFIDNGGETGYTQLHSVKDYKKIMKRELKDIASASPAAAGRKVMSVLGEAVENMNRWAEGVSRYAAFLTSREQGRSVVRSVEDAREISVNFNKKGSGTAALTDKDRDDKLLLSVARVSQLGRELFVFFNAGVQGMANFTGIVKNNPQKAVPLLTGLFLGGAALAMMNGGGGDDDDEKEYYNLPEYIRRSNICLKAGKHWLTIPMPIELRCFYGLGELAYSVMSGNEFYEGKELAYEVASQLTQILPIDFLEGNQGTMAFVPSAAKPWVEAYWLNQDWTGTPIYNDSPFNENDPAWRKAFKSTSPALVTVTRKLNEWTGGNVGRKGVINFNPARMEHLFEGYLGGVGTIMNQAYKTGRALTGDLDMREVRNIPVVSGFMRDADGKAGVRAENARYQKINDMVDGIFNEDRRLRQVLAEKEISGYDYDDKVMKEAADRLQELRNSKEWEFAQQWRSMDKSRNAAREGRDEEAFNKLTKEMNDIYIQFKRTDKD